MLTILLCAVLAIAWLFPKSGVGRLLIEKTAARLNRAAPTFSTLAVLLLLAAVAILLSKHGLALVAGAPAGADWLWLADLGAYADVLGAALLLAVTVRLRPVIDVVRSAAVRGVAGVIHRVRSRARRSRRPSGRRPSPDDGERPAPFFVFA